MKFFRETLLFPFCTFLATFAVAQTIPPNTFSHIIIIVQENRTPDNLFGANPGVPKCGQEDPFELGVDIDNGGYYDPGNGQRYLTCNISLPLNSGLLDPYHRYDRGWVPQYHNGNMDGFCQLKAIIGGQLTCYQYSYVQKSDVQPYFDIAIGYGFANYMFQTGEGGSFPAHQFLFTGTSAPVAPGQSNYLDFVGENPTENLKPHEGGCLDVIDTAAWIDPTGAEHNPGFLECYTHDSLVTAASDCPGCDRGFTWRYYTPAIGSIWDAPESIPEVCYGQNNLNNQGQPCGGTEWSSHIALPNTGNYDSAPILDDIASCNLQQISWVIPDEVWSDHPGGSQPAYGPSWVGDIIDAVGNSYKNSGKCDYWGTSLPQGQAEPTAIFVVWDDWGGWYDHVKPFKAWRQNAGQGFDNCPDPTKQWGCGYTYGFRVPFLAVSEYTQAGYVSGACTGNCPNMTFPYVHDFGSILAFTEYNFGMKNITYPDPYYADYNAPDWSADHKTVVPLSDFFSLSNQRGFTNITTPYGPGFFQSYYSTTQNGVLPQPTGPDGDDQD